MSRLCPVLKPLGVVILTTAGSLPPLSDESDADDAGHSGDPRVDTAGAARSGGDGRAPKMSSE